MIWEGHVEGAEGAVVKVRLWTELANDVSRDGLILYNALCPSHIQYVL